MESSDYQPRVKKLKTNKEEDELKVDEKEERKKKEKEVKQFVKLFDAVLQQNIGNLSDEDIEEGVTDAIDFFRKGISSACDKEKLNTPNILLGFFHRYSPLYAGKTRRMIVDALLGCEKLRSCFHRPSLKMVDVGCGTSSALVGLYSALYEEDFPFQSLEVTAMDYNKNWENFFNNIVIKLREDNFGNASKLFKEKEIKCSFVCFDMLKTNGCKKEKCLNEANIIFMKGVVSILREDYYRDKIIKNVASAMKPGALLLFIDSPSYYQYSEKKEYHLSLVFYTKTIDPTDSEDPTDVTSADCQPPLNCNLTTQNSILDSKDTTSQSPQRESQKRNPVFKSKLDKENRFNFSTSGVKEYGPGFAPYSNQEIYIFIKE